LDEQLKIKSYHFNLRVFVLAVATAWTVIIAASLYWNIRQIRKNTLVEAVIQARVAHEKDITYRRWNTMHGGVYVKISEESPPNPYLAGIPERDVETTTGTRLTLVNPAYMTRQANELQGTEYGVMAHITSLNPLRPENAPDEWERQALEQFEKGAAEVHSVSLIMGKEYMRLMHPLRTEEGCLRCHLEQGYQVGDVRGGLSAAIPMEPFRAIEWKNIFTVSLAHSLLWVLGLAGHFLGTRELVLSEKERLEAEKNTRRYARELEETNRLKDLFIDIMRHDLLNPTGVIKCYVGYLLEEETDPRKRDLAQKIEIVNSKLTEMIENASKYSRLEEMKEIECSREDLNKIVREAVLLVTCQGNGAEMEVKFMNDGEAPAWVNSMIGDVFVNLTSNAMKYAGEGKRIEVNIEDSGNEWRVSVKDFGPGISDEDKETIFTRFERLQKESVQGTGLGLAIARRVVDLHGGRIWVEDNPEGGCIFFVSLPKGGPPPVS
jgi:signal transduction histidine kinase